MADDKLRAKVTQTPPAPPRLVNDWKVDMPAMRDWLAEFYLLTVVSSGLLDPVYQATQGNISFSALPDPEQTTVGRAQKTANLAWEAGEQFKEDLEADIKKFAFGGTFTITGAATSASPVFDQDLGTIEYFATATPSSGTGTPANDAFRVIAQTKGTGSIAFTVAGAPGVGNSVTYDYIVIGKFPKLRETEEA